MNEQIKALAQQADLIRVLNEHAHEYGNGTFDNTLYPELEKFAELIVGECCKLIDDSTPVYSPENLQEDYCQGKLDGYRSALLEIKEHFGVE